MGIEQPASYEWYIDWTLIKCVMDCDVGDGDFFGAGGFALGFVGAVAEAELVHLGDHGFGSVLGLDFSLRQQCQLGHLG